MFELVGRAGVSGWYCEYFSPNRIRIAKGPEKSGRKNHLSVIVENSFPFRWSRLQSHGEVGKGRDGSGG